jgi:hypothetical protein
VKVPPVPLKTPTVPVKAPTVPVKVPSSPVEAPTIPSIPGKAPALPVHVAPRSGSPLPVVSGSPAPGRVLHVAGGGPSAAGAIAPSLVPGTHRTTGAGVAPTRHATGGGPLETVHGLEGLSRGGGGTILVAGSATGISEAGGRAIREISLLAGARGKHALAAAHLRLIVGELLGCLPALKGKLGQVLRLRTGLGGRPPMNVQAAARLLHVSSRRLVTLEILALRQLRVEAQTTGCAGQSTAAQSTAARAAGLSGFVVAISDLSTPLAAAPQGGVAGAFYLKPGAPAKASPRAELGARPSGAAAVPLGQGRVHGGSPLPVVTAIVLGVIVLAGLLATESVGGALFPRRRRRS